MHGTDVQVPVLCLACPAIGPAREPHLSVDLLLLTQELLGCFIIHIHSGLHAAFSIKVHANGDAISRCFLSLM